MFKKLLAVAVASIALNVHASILIDFSGIAEGAQVLDYYNGGTDSTGASGTNYGVHFDGGVIEYDAYGARIKGGARMTFNSDIVPVGDGGVFYIGFLATFFGLDGQSSFITGDQFADSVYVAGTENPYCYNKTPKQCYDSGWKFVYPSYMGGYYFTSFGNANTIGFNTDAVDNIEFGVSGRPTSRPGIVPISDVPEPSSIALFGISALGLWANRRRKRSI